MVDVSTDTEIARSADDVFAYAADPANATEWYAKIDSSELLGDGPLTSGSRIAFRAKFLGRRLSYTYEVAELVPGRRLVMRTADGPFPMETVYEATSLGPDRCNFVLRNKGEPAGFSKLFSPFMEPAMRRANTKDLAALKTILES